MRLQEGRRPRGSRGYLFWPPSPLLVHRFAAQSSQARKGGRYDVAWAPVLVAIVGQQQLVAEPHSKPALCVAFEAHQMPIFRKPACRQACAERM